MAHTNKPAYCGHCGYWHSGPCPRICAIEYFPNGKVKRVEYFPMEFYEPEDMDIPPKHAQN